MILESMNIRRKNWGANEGKLCGEITYKNPNGEVTIVLTNELSNKLIAIIAEDMVVATKELAMNLTAAIINQVADQIENKSTD